MMDQYLHLHRTVEFSRVFSIKDQQGQPQPLSDETTKAIQVALGTSDLDYWKVVSDKTVLLPFHGADDDAMLVTLDLGDQPKITLDNEISEVIDLGIESVASPAMKLDGSVESLKSCRIERPMCFKFYVPELYQNMEFLAWLENSQVMTWHQRGTGIPDEDSLADVTIFVDPSLCGDGTDSDMPGHDLVVERIKQEIGEGPFTGNHFVVVLTNFEN